MTKLSLIVIALFTITYSSAQVSTYLNYDVNFTKEKYDFEQSLASATTVDSLIQFKSNRMGSAGLTLTQQLGNESILHLELGAYFKHFGVRLTERSTNPLEEDKDIFNLDQKQMLFPFRVMARDIVFNNKVMLSASLGANYVIECFDENTNNEIYTIDSKIATVDSFNFVETYTLLEWNLGADICLFNDNFFLGLRYREAYNTRKILNIDLNTKNGAYSIKSRGNYNSFGVVLTYRISSFWD